MQGPRCMATSQAPNGHLAVAWSVERQSRQAGCASLGRAWVYCWSTVGLPKLCGSQHELRVAGVAGVGGGVGETKVLVTSVISCHL